MLSLRKAVGARLAIFIISSVLLWTSAVSGFAASLQLVQEIPSQGINAAPYMEFTIDPADDPRGIAADAVWLGSDQEKANFGVNSKSYWARLQIENPGTSRSLYIVNSTAGRSRLFDQNWRVHALGLFQVPPKNAPISRFPAVPVQISHGTNILFYKVDSAAKIFSLELQETDSYARNHINGFIRAVLCLGVVLGVFLYYFFTLFGLPRWDILFYALFSSTSGFSLGLQSGSLRFILGEAVLSLIPHILFFVFLGAAASIMFTVEFLEIKLTQKRLHKFMVILALFLFLGALISPITVLLPRISSLTILMLTHYMIAPYIALSAYRQGKEYAFWFFLAKSAIFVPMLFVLLVHVAGFSQFEKYASFDVLIYCVPLEMILIAVSLSWKIKAKERALAEELRVFNEHLQELVEGRTSEIGSYLANIKQGIFQIARDAQGQLRISKNHSVFLRDIFQCSEEMIAQKDPFSAIFDKIQLSQTEIAMIDTQLSTALGEDLLQWQANEQHLPREALLKNEMARVEIDWSPIVNAKDRVDRVLLAIKDVTQLRALQAEALENARKGIIVVQLASLSPDKVDRFIVLGEQVLGENSEILNSIAQVRISDNIAVNLLSRNLHTLKGSARSLQLNELAEALHDAENHLQFGETQILRKIHENLLAMLRLYRKIDQEVLGRTHLAASTDIPLISSVETLVQWVKNSNSDRDQIARQIRLLVYTNLAKALDSEINGLNSTAKICGLSPPLVIIKNDNYHIEHRISMVLSLVFLHLFRNSLAHGLEDRVTRQQLGKPEQGSITIELLPHGNSMSIKYQDDGQGLNLKKILEKAIASGIVTDHESLSDEAVAALIFHPRLSTNREIDEMSGRGVGMDAIRSYIEKLGGSVQLILDRPSHSSDRRSFHTVIELELKFFQELSSDKIIALPIAA